MLVLTVFAVGPTRAGAADVDVAQRDLDQIREYVEDKRLDIGVPGISVGIVVDGRVVMAEGFGEATVGVEPMTPQHLTLIASLSKSMTAMAVMVLADDRLVDLDQPITTYLPELEPSGNGVTVRDLMHHRSGLSRSVGNAPFVGGIGATLESNVSRLGPDLVPGSGFEYSNANYDTLALLVERVSGVPYPEFVHRRIFEPAGMDSSVVGSSGGTERNLATGYYHWTLVGYRPHTPWMQDGMTGSYTVFSNVDDLARYMMIHLDGGSVDGRQIVSPGSLSILHESVQWGPDEFPVGYGGGWNIYPGGEFPNGGRAAEFTQLAHDGSSPSYRSFMVVSPGGGTGVVVLANGSDDAFGSAIPQIGSAVVDLLYDDPPRPIARPQGGDRWAKQLLVLLATLQVALGAAMVWVVLRVRRTGFLRGSGWAVAGTTAVFSLLAIYLLTVYIPADTENRLAVLYSLPDLRVLFTVMVAGSGWGVIAVAYAGFTALRSPTASVASSGPAV